MILTPLYKDLMATLGPSLEILPDKPEETPESTLLALWHTATGDPKSPVLAGRSELPPLAPEQEDLLRELVRQRLSGTPLAHLTGRQHFMGLEMLAEKGALIPRKETEILGWATLERIREKMDEHGAVTVVDVCTGSGNLALAWAHHAPQARIYASDLCENALDLAARNGRHLSLDDRVEFRQGDLLEPFQADLRGAVDILACNPPYISSGKVIGMKPEISGHEPSMAFDGGPFGISILTRLVKSAPEYLRPRSWLCFEVGAGQGDSMARKMERSGNFSHVERMRDGEKQVRALLAQTH